MNRPGPGADINAQILSVRFSLENAIRHLHALEAQFAELRDVSLRVYFTHSNGARPFKVEVREKQLEVCIFEQEANAYVPLLIPTNVRRIFVGKDSGTGIVAAPDKPDFDGNSILLEMSSPDTRKSPQYMFIGDRVYTFSTPNDQDEAFYSLVGNNDVPYPVALGRKRVYFMLDAKCVKRSLFPDDMEEEPGWKDAYQVFYGHYDGKALDAAAKPVHDLKLVAGPAL